MKKILLFLVLLAFLATPAFASFGVRVGGTQVGTATDLVFPTGTSYTFDGSSFTISSLSTAIAAITSGTIDGATVGANSASTGAFTTLSASGATTLSTTLGVTGITTLTGALKANGGIDLTVAGALAIGASTATSVVITPATTITGILTQTGRLNANGGVDVTSAGALNLGATTATSVAITPPTTITGILTQTGRLNANGGVDTTTAIPLTLGATTASAVTITPATTITGILTQTGRLNANGGIDTTTAIPLTLGAATASAVNITPPTNITGATAITGALTLGSTLVSPGTASYGTYTLRTRVPIASVNSGVTLLAAISGRKIRIVDCYMIAYGGAVTSTTATGAVLKGYQSGSVNLFVVNKAQLTESALNRFGTTSTTILADGASLIANDANNAITFIANGGSDLAGATGIDVILTYAIE